MVKKMIRKLISKFRNVRLKNDFNRRIKSIKKKAFLFGAPMYWNIGDQAIAISEHQLWQQYIKDYDLIDVPRELWLNNKKYIIDSISDENVILFTGGGYIGDVWTDEQSFVEDVVNTFKNNKIVFFPQTVFFKEYDKFIKFIHQIQTRNVIFYARDDETYYKLNQYSNGDFQVILSPDMVLRLSYCDRVKREKKAVFCIRQDKEKVHDENIIGALHNELILKGYEVQYYSTVKPKYISSEKKEKCFFDSLNVFQTADIVITDRLHGMILSAITGTPVMFFDNLSKKVTGSYKWIDYNKYILYYDESIDVKTNLAKIINIAPEKYNNEPITHYYIEMINSIDKKLRGE